MDYLLTLTTADGRQHTVRQTAGGGLIFIILYSNSAWV